MGDWVKFEIEIHPNVFKALRMISELYETEFNLLIMDALYHYALTEADGGFIEARDKIRELLRDL